jgi:hypothetical protein
MTNEDKPGRLEEEVIPCILFQPANMTEPHFLNGDLRRRWQYPGIDRPAGLAPCLVSSWRKSIYTMNFERNAYGRQNSR